MKAFKLLASFLFLFIGFGSTAQIRLYPLELISFEYGSSETGNGMMFKGVRNDSGLIDYHFMQHHKDVKLQFDPKRYWVIGDVIRLNHRKNTREIISTGSLRIHEAMTEGFGYMCFGYRDGITRVYKGDNLWKEGFYYHGYRHGAQKEWNENGVLISEAFFNMEERDSSTSTFYWDGQISSRGWYKKGIILKRENWWKNGSRMNLTYYKKPQTHYSWDSLGFISSYYIQDSMEKKWKQDRSFSHSFFDSSQNAWKRHHFRPDETLKMAETITNLFGSPYGTRSYYDSTEKLVRTEIIPPDTIWDIEEEPEEIQEIFETFCIIKRAELQGGIKHIEEELNEKFSSIRLKQKKGTYYLLASVKRNGEITCKWSEEDPGGNLSKTLLYYFNKRYRISPMHVFDMVMDQTVIRIPIEIY